MKRSRALVLVVCALVVSVASWALAAKPKAAKPAAEKPASQTQIDPLADLVIGEPIRFKNLTIFPVASKEPNNDDLYITLDEGLKAGTVQVFEVGSEPGAAGQSPQQPNASPSVRMPYATQLPQRQSNRQAPRQTASQRGPDVNRLMVLNQSTKPLYLMPGEIIYGGQQDRTIGEELIVAASTKAVEIHVFCVEHGRWSSRTNAQTSEALGGLSGPQLDAQSRQRLAEEARQGKFVAPAGSLNKSARAAVQSGKGQGEVWNEVGKTNALSGVKTASGAFTANYTDAQVAKELSAYIEAAQTSVSNHKQVVGAIAVVNGKVEAVDIFQSTPLFQKLWPKLLKSHALDAMASAKKPDAEKTCGTSEAHEFLKTALAGGTEAKSQGRTGLVVTKRESEKVLSFSTKAEASDSAAPAAKRAVHAAGYAK